MEHTKDDTQQMSPQPRLMGYISLAGSSPQRPQRNAQPWGTWHLLMPPRNLSNELWPSRHMYCHGLSVHCPPQTVVFRHLDPSWFPIWKVKQLNKEGRENSRFQSLGQGGWGGTGQRQQSFRDPACKKYPTLWTVFKCLWNLFKFTIVLCHLGT